MVDRRNRTGVFWHSCCSSILLSRRFLLMRHTVGLVVSACVVATAACKKGETQARAPEGATVNVPATSPGGTATTIHLVVEGGKHAGTYDAKSSDITCSYGITGP